jgi:hypothetical protein
MYFNITRKYVNAPLKGNYQLSLVKDKDKHQHCLFVCFLARQQI